MDSSVLCSRNVCRPIGSDPERFVNLTNGAGLHTRTYCKYLSAAVDYLLGHVCLCFM